MRQTRGLLLLSLTLALVCSAVFATWAGRSSLNPGRVAMGPEPWRPANWDVTVHSRDRTTWTQLEAAAAHHGGACEPPPATHVSSEYADAVFACRGHVMTAINASGYGVVYLTPNRQLDFSNGVATLEFDLSTLRSSTRDWVDVWLTPYDDTLQLALDGFLPDGSGEPRNAVHVRMDTFYPEGATIQTIFRVSVVRDFRVEEVPGNDWTGYERLLTPSATRRDTFRLEVGRTRVRFGMPDHDFWWVDAPVADLGWDQAVVQLGHHSYTPAKDCAAERLGQHGLRPGAACGPNTWHWSDVRMSRSRPFTIVPADERALSGADDSWGAFHFRQPAPSGGQVRFAAIGERLEISVDGGMSWRPASAQPGAAGETPGRFRSYRTPVPAGTTTVLVRGAAWWGGPWMARDASIWAPPARGAGAHGTALAPAEWPMSVWLGRALSWAPWRQSEPCARDLLFCS